MASVLVRTRAEEAEVFRDFGVDTVGMFKNWDMGDNGCLLPDGVEPGRVKADEEDGVLAVAEGEQLSASTGVHGTGVLEVDDTGVVERLGEVRCTVIAELLPEEDGTKLAKLLDDSGVAAPGEADTGTDNVRLGGTVVDGIEVEGTGVAKASPLRRARFGHRWRKRNHHPLPLKFLTGPLFFFKCFTYNSYHIITSFRESNFGAGHQIFH